MLGTVRELAERVDGRVVGDADVAISRIAAVSEADGQTLTFATDARYLTAALASKAAAVLVDATVAPVTGAAKPMIVVENARAALARLLAGLRSPRPRGPFRHPSAVVEAGADVAADVYLDAHATVARGARVGPGSVIGAGAYVGPQAVVGAECWLHPHATLMERCRTGDRVVLHGGCVIGSEGFGWAFVEGRLERIPQVGNVELGDDVEIGANSCVDRAQTGSTTIGDGTKVDNLVQIGHNCRIGKHCAIAALTGLAGSTVIGDHVKLAGQVGTRGHMTIGSGATVGGRSGVWNDIPEGMTVSGNPARDHRLDLRREVMLRGLPKLLARVEALERERTRE